MKFEKILNYRDLSINFYFEASLMTTIYDR